MAPQQKKRGRSFWTPLVLEYEQASGVTQAAFADKHGVRADTFRKWLYQIRKERKAPSENLPVRFVEVEPTPFAHPEQVVVEVGQVRVEVDSLPDPGWLAELAHRFGGSSC